MHGVEDRAAGVLLGIAAGDRIGGPVRMALRVAESLRERGGFDASDVASRYLAWWRNGAFDTGPTAAEVLRRVDAGWGFDEAVARVDREAGGMTAGCNPAHRCAPLAMCAALDDPALAGAAIVEARLTHRHPLAGEASAAVACLCRALIRGVPWPDALRSAAEGRASEIRDALEGRPRDRLSRGGFAPEALAAAVFFVGASSCFADALARSIAFAGPANYCPVLVGSIGGARWGRSGFDGAAIGRQADVARRLEGVAEALASGWRK